MPYDHSKYLPQEKLSFIYHLADHCNLNCKGCDHFSSIAGKNNTDFDTFKCDMHRMAELFGDKVEKIGLMGGEPLLNQDICKFIKESRSAFPQNRIRVVTNGLLLCNMPQEFWDTCRKCHIEIEYTKYPVNLNFNEIEKIADHNDVTISAYGMSGEIQKSLHFIPLDIKGEQNPDNNFSRCYHANNCVQVKDGKIYTCTVRANMEVFCDTYDVDMELNENDCLDIYKQDINAEKILRFLAAPIPFCRYCYVNKRSFGHPWRSNGEGSIYDWIPYELDTRGISTLDKYRKIIVYGAGIIAHKAVTCLLQHFDRKRIQIVVTSIGNQEDEIEGIEVIEMHTLSPSEEDVFLIATNAGFQLKIENLLVERGYKNIYLLDMD